MDITKVYPLDAVFDNLEDVPEDVKQNCHIHLENFQTLNKLMGHGFMQIKANKRYAGSTKWTVQVHLHRNVFPLYVACLIILQKIIYVTKVFSQKNKIILLCQQGVMTTL